MSCPTLGSVRLAPVVELAPGRFATRERDSPDGGPEAEDGYWRASLADAGLDVPSIQPGTWLVEVERLADPRHLETIVAAHLRAAADEDGSPPVAELLESLLPLHGGFALLDGDGRALLLPRCCCDLGTLDEWRSAAAHDGLAARALWIGHPEASASGAGERVLIASPRAPAIALDRGALARAVDGAERTLESLAARLTPIAATVVADAALGARLARRLAGLV